MGSHLLLVKDTKLMFLRHIRSALSLEAATQNVGIQCSVYDLAANLASLRFATACSWGAPTRLRKQIS